MKSYTIKGRIPFFKDIRVPPRKKLSGIFELMKAALKATDHNKGFKTFLLYNRWPWHLVFWIGYALFRFWLYYVTATYYPAIFLEYMFAGDLMLVAVTYFTLWLYRRLFKNKKHFFYFAAGTISWLLYLWGKTVFQFYYLRNEPAFQRNSFTDIFISSITVVIVFFLFVTACKYVKDAYISQQFEAEKKEQQLLAEVNNLKSQIAPHFLFNTLNNLYGLAVDKSDKLPGLMLRLSDILRHSLYETQKPLVPLSEEMNVLKSYIELETVRLENDLKLDVDNRVPQETDYAISPLILIVFMENAFKHAKFVQGSAVEIYIQTTLEQNLFSLTIKNNYNNVKKDSANGIGLSNVKRRLEVLYPQQHELSINKDERFFTVQLQLRLMKQT